MLGLLLVSVLGGAALASVVSASSQGRYQGPCVPTAFNGAPSAFSNSSTITNGIWETTTSLNGTVHHWCIVPSPMAYSNATGIFFTPIPAGGVPPGWGVAFNGVNMTIFPLQTGIPCTPTTCPPSPVSQNTTTTSSTH